uniref:Uncharacterized protein n=1 Tax=Anguilla anguilla TaxID=7936 RepID=A0A0E9VRW0_ANGAN
MKKGNILLPKKFWGFYCVDV